MPEADAELTSMTQTLGGLMTDSLSGDSFNTMQSDVSNEETDAILPILQEASAVAEQQTDENFPTIPTTTTPTGQPSQTTSNSMNFLE